MKQRANLRSPLFLQYESRPAEVESENLMLYSEEFSGANWSSTNTSITADLMESPDGTTSGDKVQRTSTSASYRTHSITKPSSQLTYTTSMFVKKGRHNHFSMRAQGVYPSRVDVRFNLDTGEIYQAEAFSNFDILDYGTEYYGKGWYRVYFTYTSDTSTSLDIRFTPRESSGVIDGSDTSDDAFIYIWGAQTEQSSSVSSYIKTEGTTVTRAATTEAQEEDVTAELRIYSGGGGYDYERTNLALYSEDYTQTSYWSSVIDVVATKDEAIAPDGTFTANKIQANSGTNFKILRTNAFTIPSGVAMSMFVKRGNHDYIIFKAQGDYSFNLSTLQWGGIYSNVGCQDYGNGWVRLYTTTNSSVLSYFGIYLTDSNFNQSWTATGNEFVYVWGAQYEVEAQATSYIKTEGTAVTELAYQTEAPTEATYSLTKSPENGKTTFEVAELIRDYIEQTTIKTSGTVWTEVKLSDNLQLNKYYHFLATEGYIDNTEGLQTYLNAPSNETFMQSNSTVLIPEGQSLEIPVNAQYNSFYTITTGGVEGSAVYFSNLDDNSTQVEYITVNSTDEVIKLYVDSVVTEEITIQKTECSKYADHLLMFVNKYGAKQDFYVNMKSTEKFKIKDDGFSRSVIDYNTLSVNNGIHSYKRRILESKETYTLNTPFLDEENVQAFEELLLSEYVWLKKEGADYIPVIIKDTSMTRRTHLNDKLIQYTVEVESANHLVNIQR